MTTFYELLRKALNKNPTRGDIQKARRTVVQSAKSFPESPEPSAVPTVPKAPNFTYKNPATDDSIAFWRGFADKGAMSHYDDLMYILDEVSTLDDVEDIKKYMNQLKNTTMYKIYPSIQNWVADLESQYYGDNKYDLSYPIDMMRYQTTKARSAFESGYRYPLFNMKEKIQQVPSPSELGIPKIADTYK